MPNPYAPKRATNLANRGKGLETLIDYTNRQYKTRGVADVRKVPTPVQIKSVSKTGMLTGYTKKGEWVDYIGIGDGRVLAFDAKETQADRFPLNKLEEHQYELLESWWEKGGCCFLIVAFTNKFEEIYLLPFVQLKEFWEGAAEGGRKSIPYSHFNENCNRVRSNNGITLDYLKALRKEG